MSWTKVMAFEVLGEELNIPGDFEARVISSI